jgi:hypothetical protein
VTVKQRRRRLVTVTRQVPVTKTVTEPGPCYTDGQAAANMPDDFWHSYFFTAASLETVAHETQRLYGVEDSMVANCHAVQTIASLAEALGDTPDDAEAIATYDYDVIYQGRAHDDGYWSPDCRDGGALDLNPGSSVWP